MTLETLVVFSIASLALAVTPGPTMLLALSNGISGGLRTAWFGIAGASLGSSLLIVAVALGLGSLLEASELLFNVVRWAGVIYLAWIGVKMWRSRPTGMDSALGSLEARPVAPRLAFTRSLTVALSNPKTVLFFAAFLPQFVDTSLPQASQFALLGSVFVTLDTMVMVVYASAGMHAVRWLSARSLLVITRSCAAGMWLLAATLALWRRPGA